jgi:membrane protease YdiL (CAAX protease family)
MSLYPRAIPAEPSRSPLLFFLLVALLSVPFAWLGFATSRALFPGIPASALAFVCPVCAACILRYHEAGVAGVRALLARAGDLGRSPSAWRLVPVALLMPALTSAAYAILRWTDRPMHRPWFPLPGALLLFLVFIVAALGEELGWSGYALDPMQEHLGPLGAALVLGVIWALWHVIAMVQAGQSPAWIAWGCGDMVATRVIMVWIYNATGRSVAAVALYHAIANLSIKSWFPGGSYEGERVITVLLVLAAIVTVVTARVFGSDGSSPRGHEGHRGFPGD